MKYRSWSGKSLIGAIDDDLKTAGPNPDFEPWRPQSKNHREIPDDSQGTETGI